MSDGPYRNLPLSKPWRDAAEALSQKATGISEGRDLILKAVVFDVRDQGGMVFINELAELFSGVLRQSSLFASDPLFHIDQLTAQQSQTPFNASLARYSCLALSEGKNDKDGLADAIKHAVAEIAGAGIQSIREHETAKREDQAVLRYTRGRCDEVGAVFDSKAVADHLLNGAKPLKAAPMNRHAMLEEGPEL